VLRSLVSTLDLMDCPFGQWASPIGFQCAIVSTLDLMDCPFGLAAVCP